tara:strand:- start:1057 stop:1377 length:321 start_codon:yes stop_codon:yes gene_type:complete
MELNVNTLIVAYFITGIMVGAFLHFLFGLFCERQARKSGHIWPSLKNAEENVRILQRHGREVSSVVTLGDDDTWDLSESCKVHLVWDKDWERLNEVGGRILFESEG